MSSGVPPASECLLAEKDLEPRSASLLCCALAGGLTPLARPSLLGNGIQFTRAGLKPLTDWQLFHGMPQAGSKNFAFTMAHSMR